MKGLFLMRGRGGLAQGRRWGRANAPASACDSSYFPGRGMSMLKGVPSPRCHWS